tara:strand:- start:128 stop:493 length:366 start_codon:yes stop_codon:yes gene_type:complete
MAQFTLTYNEDLNATLQVGDIAFMTTFTSSGGFNSSNTYTKIGTVISVDRSTKTVVIGGSTLTAATGPTTSTYIFFEKDDSANLSGVLGHYAEVTYTNGGANVGIDHELFATSLGYFGSSK